MASRYVESVAASVVREYLSRKGLKQTLQSMEDEMPREDNSISKRPELVRSLSLEKLMKCNKDADVPFRTILEVIVGSFLENSPGGSPARTTNGDIYSSNKSTRTARNRFQVGSDLVLEEDLDESETLVGAGKAGLLERTETDDTMYRGAVTAGKTGGKLRGMSGPISSNVDDRDRLRMQRAKSGRPTSSRLRTEDQLLPPTDAPSASRAEDRSRQLDSILNRAPPVVETVSGGSSIAGSGRDRIVVSPEKETIQDVLLVGKETKPRKALGGVVPRTSRISTRDEDLNQYEYDVSKSSISSERQPVRPISGTSIAKDKPLKDLLAISGSKSTINKKNGSKPVSKTKRVGDVEFGDLEDELENEMYELELGPRAAVQQPTFIVDSKPIDQKTAMDLKSLVFGSAQQGFNDQWRLQSFSFCDLPRLQYGIVQKKGGPCGVLAAVQATLLQHLLFAAGKKPTARSLEPSRRERSEALAAALTHILWRAGQQQNAIVTLPGMRPHFPGNSRFKADSLTEHLILNTLTSKADLLSFLQQNISQFEMEGNSGVVLSLYSAILSRSISGVRSDMDESAGTLMGAHGYCTQDMVNLYMTGQAVSNVFNDIMELDSGEGPITVLKGVPGRADVGLLSLFEHYKSCQVGTYMKTPRFPIWVVCSESHFTTLFSLRLALLADWKAEKHFDLYYYDGLAKQDAEIKLTIDTTSKSFQLPSEEELVPPLDHCIRTKWGGAEVDWNGSEPML